MAIPQSTAAHSAKIKVAIITCYFLPDYVRSVSLRAALMAMPNVELTVIKNNTTGVLRYLEVAIKILWCRLLRRPDVYILGFRGQELLPFSLLAAAGKPLIFDEFIVPLAWANNEKRRRTLRTSWFTMLARISAPLYKHWLKACSLILTDTEAHAQLSSRLSGTPIKNYRSLPVGTDETLFVPASVAKKSPTQTFRIFFYGLKMTPLHGLEYILHAATLLARKNNEVAFTIVGGDSTTKTRVDQAISEGANIEYVPFIAFDELPKAMQTADLCLGGPFGDTPQARNVITGKTYQSLACGCPTIIADTDAYAAFRDGLNCLKVPLGNAEALAQAITWAIEHPQERVAIGRAGRDLYQREFSTGVIAKRLQAAISGVVSKAA